MLVLKNFVGGEFEECETLLDVYEPATGHVYAKVPDSDAHVVNRATEAAQKAFLTWSETTPEERSEYLLRIAALVEERLEDFAKAESRDQGKPVHVARSVDIPRAIYNFRFFANAILYQTDVAAMQERSGTLNYTLKTPIGVAGLISPWNLPLYLLTWKIAPALAFGNTCVCKPSEFTSLTAFMLCEVMRDAKLPKGVCNMVFGTGPRAGSSLVTHPHVPLISFTGGTVTAERIIKDSAPFCKKLSLELGGKNACIVFGDADLDKCVPTAVRSSFSNQGEICLCTSRILVHRSVYAAFVERYVQQVSQLVVGDPNDPHTNLGPLVSKEHLSKVTGYVRLARELGGVIECGGDEPVLVKGERDMSQGYFMRPTVITGLAYDARPCQEEIFGPVVTVTPFDTEAEAITWANSVKYGLAASIWSENINTVHRVAGKIHAGTVWCNCWMIRDLRLPFGGMKASGIGREGMTHSAEFFTEAKTVCIKID